jgi:P2 family phage contractile tail tube protein
MATADNILKNFNLFIDREGYAGKIESLQLPNLTLKVEEFRAGGMDAPVEIDQGMEKLEASFTLSGYDSLILSRFGKTIDVTMRGALQKFASAAEPVEVKCTGLFKGAEYGEWKSGERSTVKGTITCTYYKYTQGGRVIHEIDVLNFKRVIDGVDQLADIRKAIGLDQSL